MSRMTIATLAAMALGAFLQGCFESVLGDADYEQRVRVVEVVECPTAETAPAPTPESRVGGEPSAREFGLYEVFLE